MSAKRLRGAAAALRSPDRCNRPDYEDALADLLDARAAEWETWDDSQMPDAVAALYEPESTIADAILGDA